MAHSGWCGKDCYTCCGCELELSMPCYPCCDGFVGEDVFKVSCVNCEAFSIHIDSALANVKSNADHEDVISKLKDMYPETVSLTDLSEVVKSI